jgi:hypothetical protein
MMLFVALAACAPAADTPLPAATATPEAVVIATEAASATPTTIDSITPTATSTVTAFPTATRPATAIPINSPTRASSPFNSTFFATASVATSQTITTQSHGDLWPSCWADDDNVYAANGDGTGFGSHFNDIVVNRISGPLNHLTGVALATGNQVATIWGPNAQSYNRKPTGMACINGALYLAVQNLHKSTFDDAPSASISKSTNHGTTWTWDTQEPMFKDGQFTTIFFLDFGKNNTNAIDNYVYAYGLTNNWRGQDKLYLARVPSDQIQYRPAWQFYTGTDPNPGGSPHWSAVFDTKTPVLQDVADSIGQGGVVYNKPLNRYIYTSWGGGAKPTFFFYDAPKPWGPWERFLTREFANTASDYGGYATTIPSKFISPSGKTMWVQSNICQPCKNTKLGNYSFSLREFIVVTE